MSGVSTVVQGGEFQKTLVAGAVKAAMKAAGASSSDLWKVPVGQIRIMDGFNVRVDDQSLKDHIRSLADSIKVNGFYPHSTLAGYVANEDGENVVYLTDGHCRFAAVQLAISEGAEIEELPVVISTKGSNLEDITVGLITKNAGKSLTPFEQCVVVVRLAGFGWDSAKISKRTQLPPAKVDGLLLLASAPIEVREMVRTGQVVYSEAVHQLKTSGSGAVTKLQGMVDEAIAKGHARVTTKHREGHNEQKAVRKEAPAMFELLKALKADALFSVIPQDLQERITALVEKVEPKQTDAAGPKSEAAASDQSGTQQGETTAAGGESAAKAGAETADAEPY